MVELREISIADEKEFCEFQKKYREECKDEKIPYSLNPENLPFKDFLNELEKCKHIETLPKGFVLAKYFLIYVDKKLVGGINLRMGTNDFILNYAGHIGYGIAPWERNKGYAKDALKKLLLLALDLGMRDFLLTTDIENIASQKVILACGGVYEKTIAEKKLYWIHLENWKIEESAMAIVFYKNAILATRELVYGKQVLSCPKGHIENQESPIDTAIRECFEETNIIIREIDFIKEISPFHIKFMDHHHTPVLKTIYPVCFKVEQVGEIKTKEKRITEVFFMEIEKFLSQCSYVNVKEIVRKSLEEGT